MNRLGFWCEVQHRTVLDGGLDLPTERKTSIQRWVPDSQKFRLASLYAAVTYLQFRSAF